jgi:hypothetical protein
MTRYEVLCNKFTEHVKLSDEYVDRGTSTVLEVITKFVLFLEAPGANTYLAPVGSDFSTAPTHRFNSVSLLEDGWFGAMVFVKGLHPMGGTLGFTFFARVHAAGATLKSKRGQEFQAADLETETLRPFFSFEFHHAVEFLETAPETLAAGGAKHPIGFIWSQHPAAQSAK